MLAGAATVIAKSVDVVAEDMALEAIRARLEPESLSVVVEFVRKTLPTLSDADVKAAVWRLHSKGLVDVTPEWKFKSR